MRRYIKHRIQGYYMPEYLIDILTGGYADTFLPMSILKDRDSYTFSYDRCNLTTPNIDKMNSIQKIKLIKSVLEISERNNNFLIPEGMYKLSKNTIYCSDPDEQYERVKLMYYPDLKGVPFFDKLSDLVKEIYQKKDAEEDMTAEALINAIESKDMNRLNRYIDKKLMRS